MTRREGTSPELTGGAGYTYEDAVVAYYLAALLREEGAAGQAGIVKGVAVQQAPTFPMDDVVVRFDDQGGERVLSLQVRREIVISGAESNDRFREILQAATTTLSGPDFEAGTDAYGFVVEYAAHGRLRDLRRLVQFAKTSADSISFERKFATGAASKEVGRLRGEISGSIQAATPEEEWQFYRHLVPLRMDGLEGDGPHGTELLNRLRELNADASADGGALLDALRTIAREGAGAAQSWTRQSLLRQLRDRVALSAAPSYAADMARLEEFSRAAIADVPDEIGGVRIDRPEVECGVREQMASHRLVNLSGLPGSGKSAALKRVAETLAPDGPLLFLKHDRIQSRSWVAFAESLGLEHHNLVQVLAEVGSSGVPTLFVDGIDRIDPARKGVVMDIVRAIDDSEHLDHWTVLATSRDQGLEGYRTWFPERFYREAGIGDVTVPPFGDAESGNLAQALPSLSPLLLGSGNAVEVARRPFFAGVLARSGATRDARPQTEIDLLTAWWRGGGYDRPESTVIQRQRALLDVAVKGLRTLGRRVPARELDDGTLNQLGRLVDDGVLRSVEDGAWYSFVHDIFFEWVLFRRLVELGEDWTDEMVRAGEPPLLGRVVGLLAQKALEVPGGWGDGYRRLESMDLRSQWRREWLTAPPLTSAFVGREGEFDGFLAEDDHRLLGKFLVWFQAHHTIPNPQVLASDTVAGEADRIRFADLLGWPSDIDGWMRLLGWLVTGAPAFPKRFVPSVVQVFSVWLNAFAKSANVYSNAIVELCSGWLVELEDVLYGPPVRGLPATGWSDLESSGSELATNLRLAIARSASTYPGPLCELYERAARSGEMRRSTYAELMALASTAADICPDVLAEVARVELMEELPAERVARRRREQDAFYAYLRRIREKSEDERTPEEQRVLSHMHLPVGDDRVHRDDIGVKRDQFYYSPASAQHQPFAALFEHAPEAGLALVRGLANHAVAGWRQHEYLQGAETPIPVRLNFPWGEQVFWGGTDQYDWFTIQAWPDPLECACLALRHWAFRELDAGRTVDEVIQAVVEGNTCYGVLGLAVALALETLHVSETVLPVVTCQRLWHDDLRRFVQDLGLQSRLTGEQVAAKEYLDSREYRRREIPHLAMRFATSGDATLRARFAALLAEFPDALPYTTEEEREDDRVTGYLKERAARWAEMGDIENYRCIDLDGERRAFAFESPTPRTEEDERQWEASNAFFEENRLIAWATRCLEVRAVVAGESMAAAIRVAKERDGSGLFEERRDVEDHSPQTVVAAVAAAALLDEGLSTSDRDWAWDSMKRVEGMREPADARPGSRIPWHPARHLVAALATDRRSNRPRPDSAARLLRLTAHAMEEDVARLAFGHLLSDPDTHVQWVAGRLLLALSVGPRPDWGRDDAGTETSEWRRRVVEDAVDGLDGPPLQWPDLPVPWAKVARRTEYGARSREWEEWGDPDPYFDAAAAGKLLDMFPVEAWCGSAVHMALLREGLARLVAWTATKLVPDWEAAPGDDTARRAATPLIEWNRGLGRLLARAAPFLDADIVRSEYLDAFPVDNEDSFSVLGEFIVDTVVRQVIDAATVPSGTLTLLDDCVDRVTRHPAFRRGGHRAGELYGWSLPQVVRALFFVPIDDAAPRSARYANGDWSELGMAMPIVSKVLTELGWSRDVMHWFLLLCERAGKDYPIDAFAAQVAGVVESAEDRWSGTTIPSRIAAMIQRLADANYPIEGDLARRLLVALDALVDLGDRRSVALERSPAFREVRG